MCGGNVSRAKEEEDPEDERWSNTSILPLGASISNTHSCLHAKEYKCNITSYCSTVLKMYFPPLPYHYTCIAIPNS